MKFTTCCGLVKVTLQTSLTRQDVADKSATRWQQVVVMEFRKRHDTKDTSDFCPRQLVTDLLWTLRQFPLTSFSITSWQLPHLRGSYGGIRV